MRLMRASLLFAAFGLVTGTAQPSTAAQTGGGDRPLVRALDDLNSGRVFEAVEGLTGMVQADPAASNAYFYLSVIHTEAGQLDMARGFIERALDGQPEEGKFHYQLGVILHRSDDRVAARSALRNALELGMDGDEAAAMRELGDVHVLLLEHGAALEAYRNAVELEPGDARNRLALGQYYLDQHESEAALEHLRAAAELDPNLDGALAGLGVALRRMGDIEAAIETLRGGVDINPADQTSRYALAQSLAAAGRIVEARNQEEAYRQLETRISASNAALDAGARRFEAGDLAEARRLFEEAVALAPNYSAGHRDLGRVLLADGEPESARAALERAVLLNPLNADAYYNLGTALRRVGRMGAAFEAARRATVLDGGNARYRRQLVEIRREMEPEPAD